MGARTRLGLAAATLAAALHAAAGHAQNPAPRDAAALVVEGKVREVFRSPRQTRADVLVQVDVDRVELGRGRPGQGRLSLPGVGEPVYVHVPASARGATPAERQRVRVFLVPRSQGGWEGTGAGWFEATGEVAARTPDDPEPPADAPSREGAPAPGPAPANVGGVALKALGVSAEVMRVRDRLALKVTAVQPDGPAATAGLEVNDVIVGVNGAPITGPDQFDDAVRRAAPAPTLNVVNVRTGELAEVPVKLNGDLAANRPDPKPEAPRPDTPATTPAPAGDPLGLTTEPVRLGGFFGGTALKVKAVRPGSPAQAAGLEVGDVILKADGATVSSPDQLAAAVRKGGAGLTLGVRDVNSGREVPVKVDLAARDQPAPRQPREETPITPSPAPAGGGSRSLGVRVESATLDVLPVVRVVEVAPGSPAETAGLRPGDVITAVNGAVVFAPDVFESIVGKATGEVTLSVRDARSGAKSKLKVNLGGR